VKNLMLTTFIITLSFRLLALQAGDLSSRDMQKIGKKIWHNECNGTIVGLTSWNKGEDFASLGIGHFIWYAKDKRGIYSETFPDLLKFLKAQGHDISFLKLDAQQNCPWQTREAFLAVQQDDQLVKLRKLLADTVDLQAQFIIQRLQEALPKLVANLSGVDKKQVTQQFNRLLASGPAGAYALIDYINFKGEGVAPTERYKGQGWGLLQVLQNMRGQEVGKSALAAFSASAEKVLPARVENSPQERGEIRWLSGWIKRIRTYLEDFN
jgi:hypothetical protein